MGLFDLLNGIAGARSQERMDAVEPSPAIPGQPTEFQEITDSAVAGSLNPNEVDEMSRPYFPTDQQSESQQAVASTINSVIPEGASFVSNISSQPAPSESPLPAATLLSQEPISGLSNAQSEQPHFIDTPIPSPISPPPVETAILDGARGLGEIGQASPISAPISQEPSPTVPITEKSDAVNPTVPAGVPNLESLQPIVQQDVQGLVDAAAVARQVQEGLGQAPIVAPEIPSDKLSGATELTERVAPSVPEKEKSVNVTRREFLKIMAKAFDDMSGVTEVGLSSLTDNQGLVSSFPDLPKAA